MGSVIIGTVVITIIGWEILKVIVRALCFYGKHKILDAVNSNHDDEQDGEELMRSAENKNIVSRDKQIREALFGQALPLKYSIEPHGSDGAYVLYFGRDNGRHGLNLCKLSEFDANGEATRDMIVEKLNTDKLP